MLDILLYACLVVPWTVVACMIAADELSCWKPRDDDKGEPAGWTVPSTACPRCGGNTWYDRDRDELRCDTCEWPDPETEAKKMANESEAPEARSEPGNTAAMREALVAIRGTILRWYDDDVIEHPVFSELWDLCSAVSAPARNCDRFADAEAARRAWLDDAGIWNEFRSPELELHEWLFAMAKRKKADPERKP